MGAIITQSEPERQKVLNWEVCIARRVCVVNQAGNVLLDEYVKQKERVTDYRTRFSGIRPADLVGAPSLEAVQAKVAAMFKGRIVVGHSITNDLTVSFQARCLRINTYWAGEWWVRKAQLSFVRAALSNLLLRQ